MARGNGRELLGTVAVLGVEREGSFAAVIKGVEAVDLGAEAGEAGGERGEGGGWVHGSMASWANSRNWLKE